MVKPGGTIAFTDWVEGPAGLSDAEAVRFMTLMKFATGQDIPGYARLPTDNGCTVTAADDTGRFASYLELDTNMVDMQLTYDAMRIIGFNLDAMQAIGGEFAFMRDLAHAGEIVQGRFIARRN